MAAAAAPDADAVDPPPPEEPVTVPETIPETVPEGLPPDEPPLSFASEPPPAPPMYPVQAVANAPHNANVLILPESCMYPILQTVRPTCNGTVSMEKVEGRHQGDQSVCSTVRRGG
jgi:hypothetical protein